MKRAPALVAIAGVGLMLSGCVGLNVPEQRGTVVIAMRDSEQCNPNPRYPNIQLGAELTIRDENGETIQSPRLNAGVVVGSDCVYGFSVETLPERDTYTFEIGTVSKTVTREDLPTTFISLPYP